MRKRKFWLGFIAIIMCAAMLTSCGKTEEKKKNIPSKVTSSEDSTSSDNSSSEDSTSSDSSDTDSDYSWSDTSWADDFTYDSDDDEDDVIQETKIPVPEIVPKGNTANLMCSVKGGAEAEADKKRNEILNSTSSVKVTGTSYYISSINGDDDNDGLSPETAWKTTDALTVNAWKFGPGDGVLFERGGVYRTSSSISVKSGMTYAAYGTGAKPVLYGSTENYAQPDYWTPSNKKYVWKLKLPLENAGIMVFNHGEAVGTLRTGLLTLTQNGDFYHNNVDGYLYLYLDKGRPNLVYNDIEIGTKRSIFTLSLNVKNVVIDNLCMKYVGKLCVQAIGNNSNITITNCEMGWVGGSLQSDTDQTRLGNAVQFWDSASNITVTDNWVYQVYDAGLTFQGSEGAVYENISFSDNLIEYCSYGIEFFTLKSSTESTSVMKDIYMNNNIIRMSGYGWGDQRPSSANVSAINGWGTDYNGIENFNIKNNIFDVSKYNLVYWKFTSVSASDINVSGNSFYQRSSDSTWAFWFADAAQSTATNQDEFEKAVKIIDSSAKVIKWLS